MLFNYEGKKVPKAVKDSLAFAFEQDLMIRLWYGSPEKPDWLEENDVFGYVGRSTGKIKIPLLIGLTPSLSKACGGDVILSHCITRLMIGKDGLFLETYRAPFYREPQLKIGKSVAFEGYQASVYLGSENFANFKSKEEASEWISFMKGYCFDLKFAKCLGD